MKYLVIIFVSFCFYSATSQNLEVYVSAHPDDWQLFMNPNAYKSVENQENKVVFIHTTAGDAGNGMGFNNYTLAREEGSLRAIRFMCNSLKDKGLGLNVDEEPTKIKKHQIRKITYANTAAYFLRLPDGNYLGPGYETTGSSSLRKLVQGLQGPIQTIDESTSYSSLDDLKATLIKMIKKEAKGYESIILNVAETDTVSNPG